jgi:O-antigen/teichoic acid export membrane protein
MVSLISAFITRGVFVRTLSAEYLGMNGLFSSLLSLLSLAELGIGAAITYSLYQPLAEKNHEEVKALIGFFKKAYTAVGLLILAMSLALLPFLPLFLKPGQGVEGLRLYFLLFALANSVSYFFSYKRTLLVADQKEYISVLYQSGTCVLKSVSQILALLLTGSFALYLVILFFATLLENVLVSRKVDSIYPHINEPGLKPLEPGNLAALKRNTLAMLAHRIGTVVVFGTDNLLISKLVGIVEVGLYSNYSMVILALNTLLGRIAGALTPSVGNLGAQESRERVIQVFDSLFLMTFWLSGLAALCFFFLINPFISLWLGKRYLFPIPVVGLIVANFYLSRMRSPVLVFRDALGLFWNDRYKPLFESIVNLAASLVFFRYIGLAGILLGTTFSTLTTCFWIEPYILYRKGLDRPLKGYFAKFASHTAILLVAGGLTFLALTPLKGNGIGTFLVQGLVSFTVPNLVFLAVFRKTGEFRFLKGKITTIGSGWRDRP